MTIRLSEGFYHWSFNGTWLVRTNWKMGNMQGGNRDNSERLYKVATETPRGELKADGGSTGLVAL